MPEQVTHTDIYHRLGVIEGAIQGINTQLAQKRDDMTSVFNRLRFVEAKVAVGVGIALVLSAAVPIVIGTVVAVPPPTTGVVVQSMKKFMICEPAGMVMVALTAVPAATVVTVVVCDKTTKPPSVVSDSASVPERRVEPK